MLALRRKIGERVFIGDNICVTVVGVEGNRVVLGVEAPRDVPVYREEIRPPAAPAVAEQPTTDTEPTPCTG